ncbi:hypothetical protein EDM52_23195 [Brevibacillus invocatus]|uniref:Uncharacterized protein n=1 Tax=Brevibacillus invocatus TaxID=173959 RepID=A0A3M8BUB9_9BACL|nr:hypothetical protein [Brevibacillus invocatus]RNB67022.1 hypothetical protein EDM52_23195 [Brevibacillus invocatus]
MAVNKEDVIKLFELLPEDAKQSAFDYLQFLSIRHTRPDWKEIDKMEPDAEPLTEEELRQMKSDAGYVTGEDAKREFGLQIDLP